MLWQQEEPGQVKEEPKEFEGEGMDPEEEDEDRDPEAGDFGEEEEEDEEYVEGEFEHDGVYQAVLWNRNRRNRNFLNRGTGTY